MLRTHMAERKLGQEANFRWRGGEISRIEGFSDAVFAFAVTLLVVSLEVPKTFDELLEAMRGFGAFGICFLLLTNVWYAHYIYFRRYGLQSKTAIVLNALLLFVVLFYVYPLKFLFSLLIDQLLGRGEGVTLENGATVPRIEEAQTPLLLTIYGIGYVAIAAIFALLYSHAYRQRAALELDRREELVTVNNIQRQALSGAIGLLSIAVARSGLPNHTSLAGFTYVLLAPVLTAHGIWGGRRQRQLAADGAEGR